MEKYDIFISYRRDGGGDRATLLHDKLTGLEYSAFIDTENLGAGEFDEKLYKLIENCTDFIVVCSPNCFDRCVNDDDWLRKEIAHAFKHKKNVIPFTMEGFTFPKETELPYDIAKIVKRNGVESFRQYFKASVERLTEKFLISKPAKVLVAAGTSAPAPAPAPPKPEPTKVGDIIDFGGYKWRVLDVQDDKALVISEYILEKKAYHNNLKSVTWEICVLREYLNREFYNNFSENDMARIVEVINKNPDNPWYGTKGGNDTKDKIFLLNLDEVVKYFGDSGDLENRKGWYWENHENVLKDGNGYFISDQYNYSRIAKFEGAGYPWWLRSPGNGDNCAADVDYDGGVFVDGTPVDDSSGGGVRPAMWIKLEEKQ